MSLGVPLLSQFSVFLPVCLWGMGAGGFGSKALKAGQFKVVKTNPLLGCICAKREKSSGLMGSTWAPCPASVDLAMATVAVMLTFANCRAQSGPTQNDGIDNSHVLKRSVAQSQAMLSSYPAAHREGPQAPALTSRGGSCPDNFHRSIN